MYICSLVRVMGLNQGKALGELELQTLYSVLKEVSDNVITA